MEFIKTHGNCAKGTACQFLVFGIRALITIFDETKFEKDLNEKLRIIEEAPFTDSKALIFIARSLLGGSEDITGARTRIFRRSLYSSASFKDYRGVKILHPNNLFKKTNLRSC